ncbi:MAG: iron export ABC transporter permease subunit FetB [Bacillota bacterium]|jgi:putative ABC transport system permease protein|nr:iron export ABC transporter permease subunit FetB [Bacillota bacterium]
MDANSYIHISNIDLVIALLFIAISAAVSRWRRLGLERDMAVGTVRAFTQLLAVGFVLQQLFNVARWHWVVLALAIMTTVAAYNAVKRQTGAKHGLFAVMAAAIATGASITLILVIGVVLRVRPWYQPQYVIPIAGMVIGNCMTGAALVVNRLHSELTLRRNQVEAALALGAPAKEAASEAMRESLRAAMMPTINSMMTVGLVHLPGMMTGQMISGASPVDAVRYQIVVMLMIAAATAVTAMVAVFGALRAFFTSFHQLSARLELGEAWDAYVRNKPKD